MAKGKKERVGLTSGELRLLLLEAAFALVLIGPLDREATSTVFKSIFAGVEKPADLNGLVMQTCIEVFGPIDTMASQTS